MVGRKSVRTVSDVQNINHNCVNPDIVPSVFIRNLKKYDRQKIPFHVNSLLFTPEKKEPPASGKEIGESDEHRR
jgi:hypothetical protein